MVLNWKHWDKETGYGEVLYKRAIGEFPEMESSKFVAMEIKNHIRNGDALLDVGCGAGHYLRSLRREIGDKFHYTGSDATRNYIDLACAAFKDDAKAKFMVSDIFNLDVPDNSFDIVMCNNLLLHLPSIKKPISELIRVAKRKVFIRSLFGDRSFRIQEVRRQDNLKEFDENGEPLEFSYYNIYGKEYVADLMAEIPSLTDWKLTVDTCYDPENIHKSVKEHTTTSNATTIVGGVSS
jgi:ubiquinone/menaquinone biosynthesis C-methylase UbiE